MRRGREGDSHIQVPFPSLSCWKAQEFSVLAEPPAPPAPRAAGGGRCPALGQVLRVTLEAGPFLCGLYGCEAQSWSSTAKQTPENLGFSVTNCRRNTLFKSLLLVLEIHHIVPPTWLTGVDTVWTGTDTGWTTADGALEVSWCLVAVLTAGDAAFTEVLAGFGLLWNINQEQVL